VLAQEVGAGGQPQGVFAVAGQITRNSYGVILVDPARHGLVVYEYDPGDRQLRLRAARNYTYDMQLESYNTDPKPGEVAELVRQARRSPSATTQP
jgi:hypothetical protein